MSNTSHSSQRRTRRGGRARSLTVQSLDRDPLLALLPRVELDAQRIPIVAGVPLYRKLGEGGMGAVYYGVLPEEQTEVAVKVMRMVNQDEERELTKRFQREARLAMKVESPNLVRVYALHEDRGLQVMIMEYVKGRNVGDHLDALRDNPAPGLEALAVVEVGIAAASGLGEAHRQGIVHRDIKPENLLVPDGSDGVPCWSQTKVADLGIARSGESQTALTRSSIFLGSPGFMAPEQAQDFRNAGPPADVFGLACTLYCMLAGRPPFSGRTPIATILNTVEKPHKPLRAYCPDVAPALEALLDRCLEKDPARRPANGIQLAQALRALAPEE